MTELFGRDYTPDELRQLTETMATIAGVRTYTVDEGRQRGMRVADVYTGSGFRFQVLIDRGMDIWATEHAGVPLAWVHPALGGPELYESQGDGWLRTFGGGLVVTCGLKNAGHAKEINGEPLGLHGRISNSSAQRTRLTEEWRGDDYVIELQGQTRSSVLFGENLLLTRTISTKLGSNSLVIEDTVRNEGFRDTPFEILYHCNFGFPVVSPASELLVNDERVTPRDDAARAGLSEHAKFDAPDPGYAEQVFFHAPRVGPDGFVRAAIVNRELDFGAFMKYRAAELPALTQWKMMGAGDYVCALEPTTYWETLDAASSQQAAGHLGPGEEINFRIEIGVLPNAEAIQKLEQEMGSRA